LFRVEAEQVALMWEGRLGQCGVGGVEWRDGEARPVVKMKGTWVGGKERPNRPGATAQQRSRKGEEGREMPISARQRLEVRRERGPRTAGRCARRREGSRRAADVRVAKGRRLWMVRGDGRKVIGPGQRKAANHS